MIYLLVIVESNDFFGDKTLSSTDDWGLLTCI